MVGQQADTAVQHTGHRAGRMARASSAAAIGAPGSLTLSITAAVAARSRAYARSETRGNRLAVVTALAGLIASFGSPQASAAAVTNRLQLCGAQACRDFRAGYGVYVFNCNYSGYQQWHWDDELEYTAQRQKATRLCLTVRNVQVAMSRVWQRTRQHMGRSAATTRTATGSSRTA